MPSYKILGRETGRQSVREARVVMVRALAVLFGGFLVCAGVLALVDERPVSLEQRVVDGIWNAANTITTLGDLTPDLTDRQKLVMIVAMLSLTVAGTYALPSLTGLLAGADAVTYRENRRSRRMLDRLTRHMIVVGYGPIGELVADTFRQTGSQVVVIESDAEAVARASARRHLVVQGAANVEETLHVARVADAEGMIVTIEPVDQKLSICLMGRALNPDLYLVALSHSDQARNWLTRAGASEVVMVDQLVANALLDHFLRKFPSAEAGEGGHATTRAVG
jgi:voltage-gated potassium channel